MPVPNTFVAGTDILASAMNENFNNVEMTQFTAEEDLTAGQTVGISNYSPSGRIARALRNQISGAYGFTGYRYYHNPSFRCTIGGDKIVVVNDSDTGDTLYAQVVQFSNTAKTVTMGTAVAVTADVNTDYYCVAKLDTDKFIVFYVEDADATVVKYRVGTVSGTTITFGSAATFFTGSTAVQRMCATFISTDKGIAIFKCTTTGDSRAVAYTVSSTTATPGTAASLPLGTQVNQQTVVIKCGTDKFAYVTIDGSNDGYLTIGTLSGTTITLGTPVIFNSNVEFNISMLDIVSPATDAVVMCYKEIAAATMHVRAATISGTVPTLGTEVNTALSSNASNLAVESSTVILMNTENPNKVTKLTLSGNTVTHTGVQFDAANVASNFDAILWIESGYFVIIGSVSDNTLLATIQGMSNNFIGIVVTTVSRGNTAYVQRKGVNSSQSGLIPGQMYKANGTGGLTAITTDTVIDTMAEKPMFAKSATEIIL